MPVTQYPYPFVRNKQIHGVMARTTTARRATPAQPSPAQAGRQQGSHLGGREATVRREATTTVLLPWVIQISLVTVKESSFNPQGNIFVINY